jgi:DNA-directed RNA polymerase subunit RPC12/RpoP
MDLTFNCSKCKQELVVDAAAAGTELTCPSCNSTILVPHPDPTTVHTMNPIMTSAAAKEDRHYAVPVHEGPTEVLIQRGPPRLEIAAKETDKQLRIKTIRRSECMEVGHDRFDDVVSDFLKKVGPDDVVTVNSVAYTHLDISTSALLTDYGAMIVYRG